MRELLSISADAGPVTIRNPNGKRLRILSVTGTTTGMVPDDCAMITITQAGTAGLRIATMSGMPAETDLEVNGSIGACCTEGRTLIQTVVLTGVLVFTALPRQSIGLPEIDLDCDVVVNIESNTGATGTFTTVWYEHVT